MKINQEKLNKLMKEGKVYTPIFESKDGESYWALQVPLMANDFQTGREKIPKNYFGWQKVEVENYQGINGESKGLDLYWKVEN